MVLKLSHIRKYYSSKEVLQDINLTFLSNHCYGVVGKNGVGKSTLLKCIVDLISTDNGSITFNECPTVNNLSFKQISGIVMSDIPIPENITGKEYLNFIANCYNKYWQDIESHLNSLIEILFDDKSIINKPIGTYLTGNKRKILICSALLHKPSILLLDEPFNGLDNTSIDNLISFLNNFKKNRILIIVSHELNYLEKIVTDVIGLKNAKIEFEASLLEIKELYGSLKAGYYNLIEKKASL